MAEALIARRAPEGHQEQTGYRVDLTDAGRYWSVRDGPNIVSSEEEDAILIPLGMHSSISFDLAKCSGAVSDFEIRYSR